MTNNFLVNRILLKLLSITNRLWPNYTFLKLKFRLRVGYWPHIKNPQSFNEKIQWLKLNDRNPEYTNIVDKIAAKDWAEARIGKDYIIPNIGVWNNFAEIDFDILPEKFVLKSNHDSGCVYVCHNQQQIDKSELSRKFKKALSRNYYYVGREWPYKNIVPKIFAEKLIERNDKNSLPDYKFMCFNGKVQICFVCQDRNTSDGLKITFFDRNWVRLPFQRHYPNFDGEVSRPKNFEKMIDLAEKLATGIKFVRVDFYEVDDQIYFGEMTFYPGSGFEEFTPIDWDYKIGDMLSL